MSVAIVAFQDGGAYLVWALMLPVASILLAFLAGGRYARGITLVALAVGLGVAVAIALGVWQTGDALTYFAGNWAPPLGINFAPTVSPRR